MLARLSEILCQHPFVAECHLAQCPQPTRYGGWVALTSLGIDRLRQSGRSFVDTQLKQHLVSALHTDRDIPVLQLETCWQFTDNIPDTVQDWRIPILDPIWLNRTSTEPQQTILRGKVPLDLHYFNGHFEHFPLAPGVIELQWVMDQIKHCFALTSDILRIDNLKFQKFVRPNDEFDLTLKWHPEKHQVIFQLQSENETCGSGRIIFRDEA